MNIMQLEPDKLQELYFESVKLRQQVLDFVQSIQTNNVEITVNDLITRNLENIILREFGRKTIKENENAY